MADVEDYLRRGSHRVHGWLDPYTARIIADLGAIQLSTGVTGGVGEIGVHMGKLFILLHLSRRPEERSFAIDVFGDQHLNIDHSGFGDRERFLNNVRRWADESGLVVIQKSSLEVRPEEIVGAVGRPRFVSIDGGHTAECAESDLRLIESVLAERGVAILDDVFNEAWPGVVTGLAAYSARPESQLRPFAISPNKVYLARAEDHGAYRAALASRRHKLKTSHFLGFEVDVYQPPKARAEWRRRVLASPAGPILRRLKRTLRRK